MISPEHLPYVTAAIGLVVGILVTWLILSAKNKARASVDVEILRAEHQRGQESAQNIESINTQYVANLHQQGEQNQLLMESSLKKTAKDLSIYTLVMIIIVIFSHIVPGNS